MPCHAIILASSHALEHKKKKRKDEKKSGHRYNYLHRLCNEREGVELHVGKRGDCGASSWLDPPKFVTSSSALYREESTAAGLATEQSPAC